MTPVTDTVTVTVTPTRENAVPRFLDTTVDFTTVRCTECPHWYGYADDKLDGWRVARDHERRVHPGEKQALRAMNAARWRANRSS